eukprot:g3185.t1
MAFTDRATHLIEDLSSNSSTPELARLKALASAGISPSSVVGGVAFSSSPSPSASAAAAAAAATAAAAAAALGSDDGADKARLRAQLQEAKQEGLRLEAAVEASRARNATLADELERARQQLRRVQGSADPAGSGSAWARCLRLEKELRDKDGKAVQLETHVGVLQQKLEEERTLARLLRQDMEELKLRATVEIKVKRSCH